MPKRLIKYLFNNELNLKASSAGIIKIEWSNFSKIRLELRV